ncbi:hypothetical protein QJQ45_023119 [Haematococcus lacustris]|nr:hypothetical protein QJQ45_023119 [Haematococcus lacustris]
MKRLRLPQIAILVGAGVAACSDYCSGPKLPPRVKNGKRPGLSERLLDPINFFDMGEHAQPVPPFDSLSEQQQADLAPTVSRLAERNWSVWGHTYHNALRNNLSVEAKREVYLKANVPTTDSDDEAPAVQDTLIDIMKYRQKQQRLINLQPQWSFLVELHPYPSPRAMAHSRAVASSLVFTSATGW